MSTYIYSSRLSYSDYLQAQSFENSFKATMRAGTRRIIASNEELGRRNAAQLTNLSNGLNDGLEEVSIDLKNISQQIGDLGATFNWGLSEILTSIGALNHSLHRLVEIARTPAQTWACEQFEIARDAYQKHLYDDCLVW